METKITERKRNSYVCLCIYVVCLCVSKHTFSFQKTEMDEKEVHIARTKMFLGRGHKNDKALKSLENVNLKSFYSLEH